MIGFGAGTNAGRWRALANSFTNSLYVFCCGATAFSTPLTLSFLIEWLIIPVFIYDYYYYFFIIHTG
jgi:hypothetical protein